MGKDEFKYHANARIRVKGRKGEFQIEHPVMLRVPSIDIDDGSFSLADEPAYRLTDSTYVWEVNVILLDLTKKAPKSGAVKLSVRNGTITINKKGKKKHGR